MRMSVEQLVTFIQSSIKLQHEDRRIAEYLRKVKLTNRLDLRTVEDLQGQGAGPKTVVALKELAEASKELVKPVPVAPKPTPPPIPPPSAAEQKRVLDEVRSYAKNYTKRLPDFICTQVTRRYYDPSGLEFWRQADIITERLTYFEQKEDYKVVLVNNRPMDIRHDQLDGASSSGEFGSMLKELMDPETDADFRWERWATLRGKRNHVFAYRVPQPRSKWRIEYQRQMSIIAGYRGLLYIDADTAMVMRITLDATEIPPTFPVQQAATKLDYDYVKIGEGEHMLPLRAEVRMREGKSLVKNEVEFRMYRKFGAEATIKFDTPEPLPPEMTNEQPVKPPSPPKP
jgi:hypothetical protein